MWLMWGYRRVKTMNGFQQSFINHHKSCELFCYFSSYYFPFQQPFHALNVLHPGCVTLKRSKLKKTNQETTSKINNPPPPMPDKQKKAHCSTPPWKKIHLLTTMLSRLRLTLFQFCFMELGYSFFKLSLSRSFLCPFIFWQDFFFFFDYFCLLSVYPVRAGGK